MGFIKWKVMDFESRPWENVDLSLILPGGEVLPKIGFQAFNIADIFVEACITNSNEIMQLLNVVDALKRIYNRSKFHLRLPYLPYARQDRVANIGEPLSVVVMTNLINSMKFDEVEIYDCHSDVGLALINNLVHINQWNCVSLAFKTAIMNADDPIIIAPDAGSIKKTIKFIESLKGYRTVAMYIASKVRDTDTGQLGKNYYIQCGIDDLQEKDIFVVDDILDGGATFNSLGTTLHMYGARETHLFITHGIFSKGIDIPLHHWTKIYTTNSFRQDLPQQENLHIDNIWRSIK